MELSVQDAATALSMGVEFTPAIQDAAVGLPLDGVAILRELTEISGTIDADTEYAAIVLEAAARDAAMDEMLTADDPWEFWDADSTAIGGNGQ